MMMQYDALLTCSTCGRRFRESKSGFKCPSCIANEERRKLAALDRKSVREEIVRQNAARGKTRSWRAP
jgi:hypothetical protein